MEGYCPGDNFFCKYCNCHMSSRKDYDIHCNGQRHRLALKLNFKDVKPKMPFVEIPRLDSKGYFCDKTASIQPTFDNINVPIIGLDYIKEVWPKLIHEGISPIYWCDLCQCRNQLVSIISHITGSRHRSEYLKIVDLRGYNKYILLNVPSAQSSFLYAISRDLEHFHGRGTCEKVFNISDNNSCHASKSSPVMLPVRPKSVIKRKHQSNFDNVSIETIEKSFKSLPNESRCDILKKISKVGKTLLPGKSSNRMENISTFKDVYINHVINQLSEDDSKKIVAQSLKGDYSWSSQVVHKLFGKVCFDEEYSE